MAFALALAATLAGAGKASAAYNDFLIQTNSCFSTTPGVALNYSQWGPYNSSNATAINVNCPVAMPNHNYTSVYLQMTGWSRNQADKLSCTVHSTGYDGYSHFGATATVPYNTAAAQTAIASINPNLGGTPYVYVTCHIPAANPAGTSYLGTVYLSASW